MRKKLKDVCMFYSGTGFPIQYQGQTKGEYPFYKVGDIANNAIAGKIYLELCNNYISSDVAKMIKGCILPKDTVVFAKIGEALKLNRRAITSCDCLIDNNAMGIAPKLDFLRIQYFYFCMKNLKMQTLAESTTVPSVRKTVLEKYEIEVPSLVEQEEIEKKLTLTQKIIEKRRQELSYLDEIIKARFVEMFGDPIQNPKGWDMPLIEEVVANEKNALKAGPFGSALKKEYYVASGYKIYGQEQVISGDCTFGDYYIDEERYKSLENCAVQPGDVLISLVGTYGKLLIMPEVFEPGIINPRLMKITFDKEKVNPYYFKFFFQSESLKKALSQNTHGGTMDILNLGIVRKIEMPLPPLKLQNEFVDFVHQVNKSKVAVQKALDETQILFDSLMQKYFG